MTEKNLDLETNETYDVKHEALAYLEEAKANRLAAFLNYSEISDVVVKYDEISDAYSVNVLSTDFDKAKNLYEVFAENELNESKTASDSEKKADVNLYESSTEKYKDNLSSAITFFICGAAGLIILLLNAIGILNFIDKDSSTFILMNILLAALFIGFIAIGFLSLKYSNKIKEHASKENEALKEVMDWLTENISKDDIESSYDASIPDEMKYFNRSEFVKNAITKEFPNLDTATVDFINDQYLEQLF